MVPKLVHNKAYDDRCILSEEFHIKIYIRQTYANCKSYMFLIVTPPNKKLLKRTKNVLNFLYVKE